MPSSDEVSPLKMAHLPWSCNIFKALRNNSSSAPWKLMPFTSSPLCNSYTVHTELMCPLARAHSYTSAANCSGFRHKMRHRVLVVGSSHSPCPRWIKSWTIVLTASGLSARPMASFFHNGQSWINKVLIFFSEWYRKINSRHNANCLSRVDNTGWMVKKGGNEKNSGNCAREI